MVFDTLQVLKLSPDDITNESALGNAGLLADEQNNLNAPLSHKTVHTFWNPGNKSWYYPVHAFIDLGTKCSIHKIFVFNGEGKGEIHFSTGAPFQWQEILRATVDHANAWQQYSVSDTTRYLRISLSGQTAPGEIVVYGSSIGKAVIESPRRNAVLSNSVVMDQLMGINAFIDDPADKLQCVHWVREYHNWSWDEGDQWKFGAGDDGRYPGFPRNVNKFQPSYAGAGKWNFDSFYERLRQQDQEVFPVLQGSVDWITDAMPHKPGLPGKNAGDPQAYAAHADHLFQMAARYGGRKHEPAVLKLAPDQPPRSGMGLLHYYENWNEPDAWWADRKSYFTPYEFAAMCSADYDGHLNTMGKRAGIKNADPEAIMAMGGLAMLNLDYLKAIKLWSDHKRNGSIPFDVINLHHYSNENYVENTIGISPEEDSLKEKIECIVRYRDREMPGIKIWITEFGYDTHPNSVQGVPPILGYTREEVQAQWIVRSYLALAAAKVDAAFLYMLRDVNSGNSVKYQSSGLTTGSEDGWKKKAGWYYVNTLKTRLKGMWFCGEEKTGPVWRYRFCGTERAAEIIWSPGRGSSVKDYELTCPPGGSKVQVVSFVKGADQGIEKTLQVKQHKVYIDVCENPVMVFTGP